MDAAEDRWERSPGYVYFIAAGNPEAPDAIKIGISTQRDIRRRLGTLQCGNHLPLTILRVIPVEGLERPMVEAARIEAELQERFAGLRRFRKGWAGAEWFTATPELLAHVMTQGVSPAERSIEVTAATDGPGRVPLTATASD